MSPPEQPPRDFSASPTVAIGKASYPQLLYPISPPVSPEFTTGSPEVNHSQSLADPILFPQGSPSPSSSLFDESFEAQRVVEGHVAARKDSLFGQSSPPKAADYKLVLEFKSKVFKEVSNNRKLWQRREMAYLKEDSELQGHRYRHIAMAPAHPARRPAARDPLRPVKQGIDKKRPRPRDKTDCPEKKPARVDRDFEALEDFCPPPNDRFLKPHCLKAHWKNSASIDLRDDPHKHLLHPEELLFAANLRLDCASYLTQKRRLFIRRLECLRQLPRSKDFMKTDAQQACKIDVNKASRFWNAFDEVDWFDPKLMVKFLSSAELDRLRREKGTDGRRRYEI